MNNFLRLSLTCFFAAISVAATASIGGQSNGKSQDCVLTPEDYAVYSAILFDRGKPEDPEERWDNKPDLVILDTTDPGQDGNSNMWGFRSASKQRPNGDTVENFNSRRQNSCHVGASMDSAISYHFLSVRERDGYFRKNPEAGWQHFYKKYPKSSGIWTLSAVGYNAAGTEALVYVGHSCGSLCGTGHLILAAKENDRWVVKNRLMLWIS
jgi:hypothetical protein